MVWDSVLASTEVGGVKAQAEERKQTKFRHLAKNHRFTPVAIETSGVIGPEASKFIH